MKKKIQIQISKPRDTAWLLFDEIHLGKFRPMLSTLRPTRRACLASFFPDGGKNHEAFGYRCEKLSLEKGLVQEIPCLAGNRWTLASKPPKKSGWYKVTGEERVFGTQIWSSFYHKKEDLWDGGRRVLFWQP